MNSVRTPTPEPPFDDPCVVHSPMTFRGGGEQYAARLAEALDAPLYTYEYDIDLDTDVEIVEFGEGGAVGRLLTRSPFSGLVHAIEYESFDVPEQYDAVVTTGASAKSVIQKAHQRRYHLLHTPIRWLYDRAHAETVDTWPKKWAYRFYKSYLRVLDQSTVPRIDDFVANSEVIAQRLRTYYRRSPTAIIYPPVDIQSYYHGEPSEYLLYLGRLEPHKGVEEIVAALADTRYRLKVAGTGSLSKRLEAKATPNIEFLGYVSEAEKLELLANCDALLFNSHHEDFGIVPVEALASGKPVIGVNEGFTRYQIKQGVNGILFDRGTDNLRRAVGRMYEQEWDPVEIQETAEQYGLNRFEDEWRGLILRDEA